MSENGGAPAGEDPSDQFIGGETEDGPRVEFYGGRGMSAFPIGFSSCGPSSRPPSGGSAIRAASSSASWSG